MYLQQPSPTLYAVMSTLQTAELDAKYCHATTREDFASAEVDMRSC